MGAIYAQVTIGGKIYPDLLYGEGDEDPAYFNLGGFRAHPEDFILATGKLWKGDPPRSIGSFVYDGKTVENSGIFNNAIVELILTRDPKSWKEAEQRLLAGIRFDPRFFPFRYNYGRLLQLQQKYEDALNQFTFARAEIPDYYRTYLHIGQLSEWTGETYYAIQNYRIAYSKNSWSTEALVRLAEHFMETGLKNRAKLYLEKALEIEEGSPNAYLGLARLEYQATNYYRAYKIFRQTKLFTPEGVEKKYDKKFHYYFAETASRVQDYETAESEYQKILQYPNDPFFASFSYKVVVRRKEIARKFSEAKKSALDREQSDSEP